MSSSDILTALVTSTLFWLTIAGIAMRSLKLEFKTLEAYFRDAYDRLDRITFSVTKVIELSITAFLKAVYGSTWRRMVVATALSAAVINGYVVSLLYSDWKARQHEIAAMERALLAAHGPEYAALLYSDEGRRRLRGAFEQIESPDGIPFHLSNAPEDVEVRAIYGRFAKNLHAYLARHPELTYDLMLSRFFGNGYANADWFNDRYYLLGTTLLVIILSSVAVDTLALATTLWFVRATFSRQAARAAAMLLGTLCCFLVSLLNYGEFLGGHEAALMHALLWLGMTAVTVILIAVPAFGVFDRYPMSTALLLMSGYITLALFLLMRIAEAYGVPLWASWSEPAIRLFVRASNLLMGGSRREAILASMVTLFPLVAVLSIAITIGTMTTLLKVTKEVALAQVYGVTVLSGSTYFFGFLTMIVTGTMIAYALIVFLGGA